MNGGLGVGVDVVTVERFGVALSRTAGLRTRLFTDRELGDATRDGVDADSLVAVRRLAARFAAKEATCKAFGRRSAWRALEVRTDPSGAPTIWREGTPAPARVSLSHDGDVAIAFVLALPAARPDDRSPT